NLNILSLSKGFIDPHSSYFAIHLHPTPNIILPEKLTSKERENYDIDPRTCELELFSSRWKDITCFSDSEIVTSKIQVLFGANFKIEKILFDDVGYVIFKI